MLTVCPVNLTVLPVSCVNEAQPLKRVHLNECRFLRVQWFPHRMGLVGGITMAGYGGGAFIWNQIVTAWINPDNLQPDQLVGDNVSVPIFSSFVFQHFNSNFECMLQTEYTLFSFIYVQIRYHRITKHLTKYSIMHAVSVPRCHSGDPYGIFRYFFRGFPVSNILTGYNYKQTDTGCLTPSQPRRSDQGETQGIPPKTECSCPSGVGVKHSHVWTLGGAPPMEEGRRHTIHGYRK